MVANPTDNNQSASAASPLNSAQQERPGEAVGQQREPLEQSNCMRRSRAALGAASAGAESDSIGPEAALISLDKQEHSELSLDNGGEIDISRARGEHDEDKDELTSLPDAAACGGSSLDNNGKQSDSERRRTEDTESADEITETIAENGKNEEEERLAEEAATCCGPSAYYSKQFNRLDPSRRSFSSPAVNLALFGANLLAANNNNANNLTSGAHQISNGTTTHQITTKQVAQRAPETAPSSKASGSTAKQRRRTALGLISFGSAHFRMSGTPASGSSQQQAPVAATQKQVATTTSTWRHWFTGGAKQESAETGARKVASGSRKFLRGLRQQALLSADSAGPTCNLRGKQPATTTTDRLRTTTIAPQVFAVANHSDTSKLDETTHVERAQVTGAQNNLASATAEELHRRLDTRSEQLEELNAQMQEGNSKRALESSNTTLAVPADQYQGKSTPVEQVEECCYTYKWSTETTTNCREERATLEQLIEVEEPTGRGGLGEHSNEEDHKSAASRPQEIEAITGQTNELISLGAPGNTGAVCSWKREAEQDEQEETISSSFKQDDSKSAQPTMGQQKRASSQAFSNKPHNNNNNSNLPLASSPDRASLVDRLIDSEVEWRQLIKEANEQFSKPNPLNSMNELQIKRQEVIHELVQTERHHCLTLALMRQVYLVGLKQLNEWRSLRDMQSVISMTANETSNNKLVSTYGVNNSNSNNNSSSGGKMVSSNHAVALNQSQMESFISAHGAGGDLIDLDRLFPALEDLIQAHELFFAHLRLRLVESCQRERPIVGLVGPLGDLLCDQFRLQRQQTPDGGQFKASNCEDIHQHTTTGACRPPPATPTAQTITAATQTDITTTTGAKLRQQQQQTNQPANGHKLLQAYAKFCGQHYDSSRYYKQLMQSDKGFKQFIETCKKQNSACRQRGIPECNLLVTQRLTKYPLLIEQLIKTSKDDPDEENRLQEALRQCKGLLSELNQQLARKESFERLLDIYARFCPKSFTIYNRHLRFTKHDLLQHKRLRQLLHSDSSIRIWSATRRKLFQVLCLILNDIVVFLRVESSSSSSSSSLSSASPSLHFYQPPATHLSTGSGELSESADSHQVTGGPLSQCALINVVASALHSAGAAHSLLSPYNSTLNNNYHSSLSATGANFSANFAGHTSNSVHQQAAPPLPSGGNNQHSVKYYFANIDNKSSVISLSKLLIREKAVQDGEPRIYLISSSPRQPEMYELAFISKRHQTSFVTNLKSCIERHNKDLDYDDDDDDDVYEDDEREIEVERRLGGLYESAFANDDSENSEQDDELEDEEEDEDDDDEDDDEDYDDEEDYRRAGNGQFGTPCTGSQCSECRQQGRRKQARQVAPARTQQSATLDYFELDIEQDVMQPPASQQDKPDTFASPAASDEPDSSFAYATPNGCAQQPEAYSSPALSFGTGEAISNESETQQTRGSSSSSNCSGSDCDDEERRLASTESGLSERAKDSLDETAPSKQKLRGARKRRAQRPRNVSNQSSSSSEAAHRQAIQLISSATSGGCGAASAGRATITGQVPAEAECCASEPLEDYEFDSGRGHDDSSSAASTSSNSLTATRSTRLDLKQRPAADKHQSATTTTATSSNSCHSPAKKDSAVASSKLLDFKLLKDTISLSTSSITSTLMGSLAGNSASVAPATPTSPRATGAAGDTNNGIAVLETSTPLSSCASSTASGRTVSTATTATTTTATSKSSSASSASSVSLSKKSNLVKCSSILSKSSCSFMKQRKLSTVSSMSCQLKQLKQDQVCCQLCTNTNRSSQHHHAARPVTLLSNSSQQSTLSKQVRQQLRRSSFIPEQKLEELRDLRIQLDKDKQEWQAKFDRMQEQLLNERRELDLAREKIKLDRQQVANEREQLYRKLDLLKEKGILLSPSHKVIITTPELRVYPPNANIDNGYHNYNQQQLNQRQPMRSLNTNQHHFKANNTSSIRIVQQQQPQQQFPQQQALNNQQSTTNLFIQSNACKVPHHLSEPSSKSTSGLVAGGRAALSMLSERFTGSQYVASSQLVNQDPVESHVI